MNPSDNDHSTPTEGTTVNNTPEVTETTEQPTTPKGSWRRLARGRRAMAAGAAVAGLAIGGIGFGAGYAVGDHADPTTQQTTFDQGDRGFPGGDMDGQMGGPPDGTQGGAPGGTGQAPDFDGDGQPDETVPDSGTDSSSGSDTGTQQS
jgi:hypothetical protein